jgi:AcrR family transcriptional regulator
MIAFRTMVRKANGRSIRRREATRGDILRAAAHVFRRRGFADAGMREIATEADLSPANLYHYFRGKDDLLYYCQDRALDRMLAAARAARRLSGGPTARLIHVLASHASTVLDDVDGATAHVQVEALPPAARRRLIAKRDRYERDIRAIVADGVARGELVAEDPAIVTRAMLGALTWTATWFRPGGSREASDVGGVIARFLVRGVAPGARAKRS